jgi:predicted Zn-dependent protease
MNDTTALAIESFTREVQSHLDSCQRSGIIEGYVCTATHRRIYAATLFNGIRHTKGPLQENRPFHLDVSLVLPNRRGVGFSLEALSMQLFVHQLEFALAQAVELRHRIQFKKQDSYPQLALASQELLECFAAGNAGSLTTQLLDQTDAYAAEVKHPRLMNREVSVSISMSNRRYCDSAGNVASENSAACSVMVAFSLEDSSESHSDLFGSLPSAAELKEIVDEASKNIVRTAVRPLDTNTHYPVLLTHKAAGDLFDQLVIPNLETRALLDKTGAWEFADLDTTLIPGLTIEDNPHLEQSPFSTVFDFEGTPTKPVKIMKAGILVHPLMTSALLAEVESEFPQWQGRFRLTGHADSATSTSYTNLFFRVEKPQLPELNQCSFIQIQNLTGMSVDPLTGQFALDADGAKVIVNGRVEYSTSLTLRGNFFEALKHPSTKVGPLERHFNSWIPSLYTEALSCVSKELAQNFEDE